MRKLQKNTKGFTLIELIITLLIGSILLAWGVPNYRDFKVRKEVSLSANEISYSFNLAKAEAIRYGTDVKVTMTGTSWEEGWEIWTLNEDGTNNALIHVQDPLLQVTLSQIGGVAGEIVFNRIGAVEGGNVIQFQATNVGPTVANSGRTVMLLPNGSARVVKS